MRPAAVVALLIALAGCASSPPSSFYSLQPRPGDGERPALAGPPLAVTDVSMPPALQRQAMVRRGPDSAVEIRGTERWAGPLDRMIQRTLAFDLAARLAEGAVLLPGQPGPAGGARRLVLVVERFSPGPDERVVLAARWTLLARGGEALVSRDETIRAPMASPAAGDAAEAMSDALAELSSRIVERLVKGVSARSGPAGAADRGRALRTRSRG